MGRAKGGTGFGHESGHHGETNVWLTPKYITDAIGPFDLDPCAANPRPWDIARNNISLPEDGLTANWEGRVFCNPPYGEHTGKWMQRMAAHGSGIALIFARTETEAWQEVIFPAAEGLLFIEKRIQFLTPEGKVYRNAKGQVVGAGSPSVLVAFSQADAECLRMCGLRGTMAHPAGRFIGEEDEIPTATLTAEENREWESEFEYRIGDGWSDEDADKFAWLYCQNKFSRLLGQKFSAIVAK